MKLTIFTANCAGNASNPYYSNRVEALDEDSFKAAVSLDHVAAEFKGLIEVIRTLSKLITLAWTWTTSSVMSRRIGSRRRISCLSLTGCRLLSRPAGVHMKTKGSKSARPRFHVYFPIPLATDADQVRELKELLADSFSFFDKHALDAARFMYGNAATTVYWRKELSSSPTFSMMLLPSGTSSKMRSRKGLGTKPCLAMPGGLLFV